MQHRFRATRLAAFALRAHGSAGQYARGQGGSGASRPLNLPLSLEEAALIDGATRFGIFTRIYLPDALSPLVIIGVGTFLGYWNSFIWPTMTITSINHLQVMQVMRSYSRMYSTRYGTVMAGSTLAALPPIILFLIFQRHIVKGIILSGIKEARMAPVRAGPRLYARMPSPRVSRYFPAPMRNTTRAVRKKNASDSRAHAPERCSTNALR